MGSTQQHRRAGLLYLLLKRQWETKREFALNADSQSREELEKVLHAPSKKDPSNKTIQVYNTNSWPRTDAESFSLAGGEFGR